MISKRAIPHLIIVAASTLSVYAWLAVDSNSLSYALYLGSAVVVVLLALTMRVSESPAGRRWCDVIAVLGLLQILAVPLYSLVWTDPSSLDIVLVPTMLGLLTVFVSGMTFLAARLTRLIGA